MKEILAGTYWLIANGDGSRAICKGKKPKEIGKSAWVIERPEMGWITLDNDIHVRAKYRDKIINKSDFQGLVFPKISYEKSPMEIEIGKSGRVYTYESEHTKENSKTS
jgi:hypothetical protein